MHRKQTFSNQQKIYKGWCEIKVDVPTVAGERRHRSIRLKATGVSPQSRSPLLFCTLGSLPYLQGQELTSLLPWNASTAPRTRFTGGFKALLLPWRQFQIANSGQTGRTYAHRVTTAKNERKRSLESACMHPNSGQSSPKYCIQCWAIGGTQLPFPG